MISITTDDGADLAVWDTGGDGAPIVLIHGFTLDHSVWDPVVADLAREGRRVLCPDLRGHGSATLGSQPPSLVRLAKDVEAILHFFEIDAAHVVGHSLGAFVALASRPDSAIDQTVSSVVAISGMARSITNPLQRLGANVFSSGVGVKMLRQQRLGRMTIKPWFGPQATDADLDAARLMSARCSAETRRAVARATAAIDLRPSFQADGPPTLVICGRDDAATPLKHSEQIAAAIAGSSLEIVDGAGHMVITEKPDQVAKLILSATTR